MKLSDIQKLCDEATPGPWRIERDDYSDRSEDYFIRPIQRSFHIEASIRARDAKFIAASRDLLPKLLKVAKATKDVVCMWEECASELGLGLSPDQAYLKDMIEELEKE